MLLDVGDGEGSHWPTVIEIKKCVPTAFVCEGYIDAQTMFCIKSICGHDDQIEVNCTLKSTTIIVNNEKWICRIG